MSLTVTELKRTQIREATELLCREFIDDPALLGYEPDPERRNQVGRVIFDDSLRFHHRFGTVWSALLDGELIGVAVCVPPQIGKRSLEYRVRNRLRGILTRRRLMGVAPEATRKLFEGYAKAEKIHPAEPHWYPMFVAIDSRYHGRGYGTRMLEPMLREADRAGLLTFSESPIPRNHPFFRRLGFTIGAPAYLFPDAPPNYPMYRQPRTSGNAGAGVRVPTDAPIK
jgi:GNAT superfamily N-acetyltransferase